MNIYPIILCGGSGTRLWPMSRGGYPKQYLRLTGEQTLVQQTAQRLRTIPGVAAPIIVSNAEQRFLVAEQLRQIDVAPTSIVLEPVARNTAPAIAVAALLAVQQQSDALMLVLPSDHVILNERAFVEAVSNAAPVAADGALVTFGIAPKEAHTGYGYIHRGEPIDAARSVFRVDAFIEKPDAAKAQRLLDEGGYYWNSGMFLIKASTYLEELREHAPEIARQAGLALTGSQRDSDFVRLDHEAFAASPSLSIDYAVMEKTRHAAVVETTELGWDDIGSWSALADISEKNEQGNTVLGDVYTDAVSNSYVRADHRMVAAIGVDNLVIVETADAVLITHRDRSQDVKKIVEWLNASGRHESVTHRRVVRPWGDYEGIDQGDRFQVKRIVVKPGAQLSLQMHHHRAEHWIVVKGTALVTNGDKEIMLTENQSTYIPLGATHRLSNPGKIPLELIEVQSGSYLGEDDIVRFEDTYGRAPK
ncbi:mannose-1-phosphate guanylyltransferase/mannose-6-phosphate isomerase [Burkholderia gladioli]|uniref:mannose-1-phosphate guanylyltransferase/mannose-6-phosphate isomerase n=1 Tax=Burkholderia gladioli TaxID=28095 RepID=UPI0022DC2150|nr:mannose-1-phosphate guanylyltransferase/mannose-6-phosphate isomerase [Burkholderia gladioli]MDA0571132.1 mannose-1-phosphate guanylyltransferase/mannose-6-phosphate isomerase [Burkholderia gladioli]MDA0599118.1 mannose-1-phosphate guanylyltransferase/mannose-6-phosphate isomerase [Burkholderia gladioli]